jgi:ubiquinone/menaquinone biosynthesis C-methylase UbiE
MAAKKARPTSASSRRPALPFKDRSFDAVVAMLMLYQIEDRPAAFDEIRRVLRRGGALYASTMGRAHMRELREIAGASLVQAELHQHRNDSDWKPVTNK